MKVSPVAAAPVPTINPNEGASASPDRLARAKAIALGQAPTETPTGDPQATRIQDARKRIKLKTQVSTDRHLAEPPTAEPPANALGDETAPVEPVQSATEEKPLSPQFAALAKQKRALQLKEQELLAKEKALTTQSEGTKSLEEYRARIKANALKVLQEEGVTYDQLTEQILASNEGSADYSRLEAEIKSLKEGLENQTKTQTQRDADVEKQVLAQIRRDADQLIAQGDDFEMVREAGYAPKVVELIHRIFKKTGEYLDVSEAAALVENELLEESLKFAKIKKVQSRLAPQQTPPPAQQTAPNTKVMRTLTNRDGVSTQTMSKRERAIAAMEGRLK